MNENRHEQIIPPEVLAKVQTKIEEIREILTPYIIALTPEERQKIPKMGEKSLEFVEKAYEFAGKNANLVPPYLDMEEFGADFNEAHGLWTFHNAIRQLEEGIDDTEMTAGSEAYQAALVFYKSVKMAAAQDVPGAKAVYEELRTRFPGSKRKTSKTETEAAAEASKK
ncbi:MAG: hypothetical protein LBD07_04715 [Spirochaetaceae bacterium]|jgi:hypothetical protein|nr:hypothetical protein [Spirochaetaceae bacterium]